MRTKKGQNDKNRSATTRQTANPFVLPSVCACACLALAVAITVTAQNQVTPGGALRMEKVDDPTPVNQAPDPNTQMQMHDDQQKQLTYSHVNTERRKQIADDSAKLLKLATDLKVEVDKTTKDTLSIDVVRKAEEIEHLAHNVKEKMKLTVGPS